MCGVWCCGGQCGGLEERGTTWRERLFILTHDGKSSGKKGVGRGRPGALIWGITGGKNNASSGVGS